MSSDTRKIVIEIRDGSGGNGGSGGSKNKKKKGNKDIDETSQKMLKALNFAFHPLDTLEDAVIGQMQSAKYIVDNLLDLGKNSLMFTLNRTYTLTEDYMGQNSLNNFMSGAGKIGSLGASMIAGAKLGAVFGPVGATVGAGIGTTFFIANEALTGAQTLQGYYSSINAATYQTEFAMQRAGLINEGRGTEN